jgi:hypothetical protein
LKRSGPSTTPTAPGAPQTRHCCTNAGAACRSGFSRDGCSVTLLSRLKPLLQPLLHRSGFRRLSSGRECPPSR